MRTNTLLIGVGFASFVLFTLISIPASVVTNRLPDQVRFGGVEGTLWRGTVGSIDVSGWRLRDARWDLNPAALLIGRLSASVSARAAGGEINADASVSVSGAMSVSSLEATGLIAPLATLFNLPVTGGRYRLQLSALDITDNWPTSLIGSVQVTDVPLNIMGSVGGPTGNYAVVFDDETVPEDGRLSGALSDVGGPVEVGGSVELTPPGNYVVRAKVKARPGAPADIAQALTLVGPVGADGKREISIAGSL